MAESPRRSRRRCCALALCFCLISHFARFFGALGGECLPRAVPKESESLLFPRTAALPPHSYSQEFVKAGWSSGGGFWLCCCKRDPAGACGRPRGWLAAAARDEPRCSIFPWPACGEKGECWWDRTTASLGVMPLQISSFGAARRTTELLWGLRFPNAFAQPIERLFERFSDYPISGLPPCFVLWFALKSVTVENQSNTRRCCIFFEKAVSLSSSHSSRYLLTG